MIIEHAKSEDAEAFCTLIKGSITELCALDHRDDPEEISRWLSNKTKENIERWVLNNRSFCARDRAGNIIGLSMLSAENEILLNYVAPKSVNKGVGKALMQAMEDSCEKGDKMKVSSTKSAYDFYIHTGFTATSALPDMLEKTIG